MSAANIQELVSAIGFHRQVDVNTALTAASMWKLRQSNNQIGQPQLVNETDADDIGKGDEWITQNFPSHINTPRQWDYYLTSENAAMLAAFGLGKVTETGSGATGVTIDATFTDPCVDTIDVPTTTMVQAINACPANELFDFALIGMALEEWTISLKQGPGRQNATMTSTWAGTGKYADPSNIDVATMPFVNEHRMGAGGTTTLTILARDYIALKTFVSLDFGIKKSLRLDEGFYPGSGQQNGYDIRGRMQHGKREATLTATVECTAGSPELDDLLNQTEGSAHLVMEGPTIGAGPAKHKIDVEWPRITFQATQLGESNGKVTVAITASIMKHPTLGVMHMKVTTEKPGIGSVAPASEEPQVEERRAA